MPVELTGNNLQDTKILFPHCEYLLVKASNIQKYVSKAKISKSIEECQYYNKLAQFYYLDIESSVKQCSCISNLTKNSKNLFTEKKNYSLPLCRKKTLNNLKWLNSVVKKIIECEKVN